MASKKTKKTFSSFTLAEAFKELGVTRMKNWKFAFPALEPSGFFHERLRRLGKFNLTSSEPAKELLIDAFCEEVVNRSEHLRIWKAAPLSSPTLAGVADYVVAPDRSYLDTPVLCVVEAKKDDFEQGLAQCLVEMKACRWQNEQAGAKMDVYGVVTNGSGWQFYLFDLAGNVWESPFYSFADAANVLGNLDYIFGRCEEQIASLPEWQAAA